MKKTSPQRRKDVKVRPLASYKLSLRLFVLRGDSSALRLFWMRLITTVILQAHCFRDLKPLEHN